MQKHVNLVDLVKSFPTNIYLQNLASIQKRTSLVKFAHLAEKSENGSISNLSTKVRHPHILNLLTVCYESYFTLVTEHCFGGTLSEMIAEDEIIPHAGVRIGIQVSSAVAYIHARGFLHGAVTSENISLLTDSIDAPFAKLTGLDTARRIDETLASHPGIDVYAVGALLVQIKE